MGEDKGITEEKSMEKATTIAVIDDNTMSLSVDESVPTTIEIFKHNQGEGQLDGCNIG